MEDLRTQWVAPGETQTLEISPALVNPSDAEERPSATFGE